MILKVCENDSYLFVAMCVGFAGGPFYSVNQSESLHFVQPLMTEGLGLGESDRHKQIRSGFTTISSCTFVSLFLYHFIIFLQAASWI